MRVTVETIGLAGLDERELQAEFAGGTVADLMNHLSEKPEFQATPFRRSKMESVLIIVNGEVLPRDKSDSKALEDGDCVTLVVPMAGG